MLRALILSVCVGLSSAALAAPPWPGQSEGDWSIPSYAFASGEVLQELRLHYTTLGSPRRDAKGEISNAVLLLHGTSGTGKNWLNPIFANEMFGPGQPLDLNLWYVILPDGIGRGGSSKPSDGLRGRFPHYRYTDMVQSEYRLLTEHLGITHLKMVLGASMGGMHAWMWAGMYPELMDVVVPLASQPAQISGGNWISRRIQIEAIRNDPGWKGGDYTVPPTQWIFTVPAFRLLAMNTLAAQEAGPSVEKADALYSSMLADSRRLDANDFLYSQEAAMDYAPEPLIQRIRAKVIAINSEDDGFNPVELKSTERIVSGIPGARYVLIPRSAITRGHFTYEQANLWKIYLDEVLR